MEVHQKTLWNRVVLEIKRGKFEEAEVYWNEREENEEY